MTCFLHFLPNYSKKWRKNTSWKFMDESSVTFQWSISGPGEFGLGLSKTQKNVSKMKFASWNLSVFQKINTFLYYIISALPSSQLKRIGKSKHYIQLQWYIKATSRTSLCSRHMKSCYHEKEVISVLSKTFILYVLLSIFTVTFRCNK